MHSAIMFEKIISVENLLCAWDEFLKGKRNKPDVQEFSLHLMDNIFSLHRVLVNKTYIHGSYIAFNVSDPKPRVIHKAPVRDRLLHRAMYRVLYPYFDKKFMADSFSCRNSKGTHRAIQRFIVFSRKVSKNNMKQCWILKCDVRKFFASIDHGILLSILQKHGIDNDVLWLCECVVRSFSTEGAVPAVGQGSASGGETTTGKGLPLGNLTSQLFANVYMNEFDRFAKHTLKAKYYVRYADDFVVFSRDKGELECMLSKMKKFLSARLKLLLHEDKIFMKTIGSGVDFLGWVHFPDHCVLRTTTKRRMMRRIKEHPAPETLVSYLGLLKHGNAKKLCEKIKRLRFLALDFLEC